MLTNKLTANLLSEAFNSNFKDKKQYYPIYIYICIAYFSKDIYIYTLRHKTYRKEFAL